MTSPLFTRSLLVAAILATFQLRTTNTAIVHHDERHGNYHIVYDETVPLTTTTPKPTFDNRAYGHLAYLGEHVQLEQTVLGPLVTLNSIESVSVSSGIPYYGPRHPELHTNGTFHEYVGTHLYTTFETDLNCFVFVETWLTGDCTQYLPKGCPPGRIVSSNHTWYGLRLSLCYGPPICACKPQEVCSCLNGMAYPVYRILTKSLNHTFYVNYAPDGNINGVYTDNHIPPGTPSSEIIQLAPVEDFYMVDFRNGSSGILSKFCVTQSYLYDAPLSNASIKITYMDWDRTCILAPQYTGSPCPSPHIVDHPIDSFAIVHDLLTNYPLRPVDKWIPNLFIRKIRQSTISHYNDESCFDVPWPPSVIFKGSVCNREKTSRELCLKTGKHVYTAFSTPTIRIVETVARSFEAIVEVLFIKIVPMALDAVRAAIDPILKQASQHTAGTVLLILALLLTAVVASGSIWPLSLYSPYLFYPHLPISYTIYYYISPIALY